MTAPENGDETTRIDRLLAAEVQAVELFEEVERRGLVAAGRRDSEVGDAVRDLANEMFGGQRDWHKRIVRSGEHTLHPYAEDLPDRVIGADDIVFCDFGPVFEDREADLCRTFVLGDDPLKLWLRDDLTRVFEDGRQFFLDRPEVTGGQLFAHVEELARKSGWKLGAASVGHIVDDLPHERIAGDEVTFSIAAGNDLPMRRLDPAGRRCHWTLEIHLVDRARGFGGFYEQLLDLQPAPA
jgi:Xaa-Pro aminopeptidase